MDEKNEAKIDNNPDGKKLEKLKSQIGKNPWMVLSIGLAAVIIVLLIIFMNGGITGNVVGSSGEISKSKAESQIKEFIELSGVQASVEEVNNKGNLYEVVTLIQGQKVPLYLTKDGEYFAQFAMPLSNDSDEISKEEAGDALLEFIESQNASGEIKEIVDKGNLYEVSVLIQGQEMPLYVTKDGQYFVQAKKYEKVIEQMEAQKEMAEQQQQQQQEPEEVPKSDKPVVDLFVMSFCPFGNKAEETMLPVYELLKDKVDWSINYIVSVSGDKVSSLHGQPEVDQNIREVCVKKEYGLDKFWKFVEYVNNNCGKDGNCWKDASQEVGFEVSRIESCVSEEGLDLMKTEAQISGDAGARGSPTLLINGVESRAVYNYENPEAYKQAICSAFNTIPEECNEKLSGSSVSASSASSGAQCD